MGWGGWEGDGKLQRNTSKAEDSYQTDVTGFELKAGQGDQISRVGEESLTKLTYQDSC